MGFSQSVLIICPKYFSAFLWDIFMSPVNVPSLAAVVVSTFSLFGVNNLYRDYILLKKNT